MSTLFAPDPAATLLLGKGRRELLALLFTRPEASLYLREIARITGASAGTTQRELRALTAVGLLRFARRGNQVFFQANGDSPLFASLRSLLELTMGIPDILRASLVPLADRLHFAGIFGSIASGASRPTGDIDVLVVGEVEFSEVADALAPSERRVARPVNPTVYTPGEFTRRVKAKSHFIMALLHGPLIPLLGALPPDAQRVADQRLASPRPHLGRRGGQTARGRGSKPR